MEPWKEPNREGSPSAFCLVHRRGPSPQPGAPRAPGKISLDEKASVLCPKPTRDQGSLLPLPPAPLAENPEGFFFLEDLDLQECEARPSANLSEAWKSSSPGLGVASSQLRLSSLILMFIISYICCTLSRFQSTFRSVISSDLRHEPGRSAGQ